MAKPNHYRTDSAETDSCRSWLIVASGFLIHFVVVGTARANALIFVALVEKEGLTRQQASWPFTVSGAATIFIAPLMGFLSARHTERVIILAGLCLFVLGSSVTFFTTSFYVLVIFYGLVRGSGTSMCTSLIPGLVNNNFKRHRATAMGIVTTGTPMGAFVFPFAVKYLLEEYGLRGTLLLLGGFALQGALGAMSLPRNLHRKKSKIATPIHHAENIDENQAFQKVPPVCCENDILKCGAKYPECESKPMMDDFDVDINQKTEGVEKIDSNYPKYEVVPTKDKCKDALIPEGSNSICLRFSDGKQNNDRQSKACEIVAVKLGENNAHRVTTKKPSYFDKNLLRSIFTSRGFYLVSLTQVCGMYLITVSNLVTVDYLRDKGIGIEEGMFMITAFAVGQVAGRLGLGWLTDRKYVSRQAFLMITMMCAAILVFSFPFTFDLGLLLFTATMLGVAHGTILPISNVTYSDYLQKEEMHLAVGFGRSLKGIASLSKIPLIGHFRDRGGSYDNLFFFVGFIAVCSSFAWMLEVTLGKRFEKAKKKNMNDINTTGDTLLVNDN